ncbi:MBL fold metallo-hydrolase [Aeromicrobium sp. NPDC092404]|uniref:MBL fold metallo-hydrolase n=1 Tax=Aeromicrobium sp. NPDC092404 TaxID=3154976 RepID=UPI0034389043
MIAHDVAPGVIGITQASTNCYLVEADDGLTFVDAGLPRTWALADQAVRESSHTWADVSAIVLTHAHFDHLGFAARAQREHGVEVWVHEGDLRIAKHPYGYHPGRPRLLYPLKHPRAIRHLAAMTAAGALRVKGVPRVRTFGDGDMLQVPGHPHVIATPGHTDGHCALHLPDREVIFTGDGLVTLDPYTGRTGPRIVARAGTHDGERAVESLEVMALTNAAIVLPGHGEPWTAGVADAVRRAWREGAA